MPIRVPRSANSVLRFAVPGLVLGALAMPAVPILWVRSPAGTGQHRPLAQPVQFDHRHHVTRAGIDCLYCHADAARAATAGVPATEVCMGCHRQVWRDAPMLEPVRQSSATGTPLSWRRVNALPGFVFFNHSIHLRKGIGCSSCHGQVAEMVRLYQWAPLTMGWCLDCHRDPVRQVRPRGEVTAAVWEGDPATRRRLAAEYDVRSLTNCSTCHR